MNAQTSYLEQIIEVIKTLDADKQKRILEFAIHIDCPKGEPGWLFLERTEHIRIDPEDLKLMERAIEEDCEQIDDEPDVIFPEQSLSNGSK